MGTSHGQSGSMPGRRTIWWREGVVFTLDQTKLPHRVVTLKLKTPTEVARAIKEMKIRGAPLIGAAAALALAQTAHHSKAKTLEGLLEELNKTAELVRKTRPTAVNLFNSLDSILRKAREGGDDPAEVAGAVVERCLEFVDEDAQANLAISRYGAELIGEGDVVLTHCNAGELATVQYGTALGMIKMAHYQGKRIKVFATETRPFLQGARLTTFELKRAGVPVTLIADSAAGRLFQGGMIDRVVVGADRIFTSGHVVNKIGTYMIAALAKLNHIPFYVAAPTTTLDRHGSVGGVKVEERDPREVLEFQGLKTAPRGVGAMNPVFDVTPPELVSAIITERGVVYPPFEGLKDL